MTALLAFASLSALVQFQTPGQETDFSPYVQYEAPQVPSVDASMGLSLEALGGVIWLADSKKGNSSSLFNLGARLTWEWSRTFFEGAFWRKAFFVDLTWSTVRKLVEGTQLLYAQPAHHYLVLAPAVSLPLFNGIFALFAQSGVGLLLVHSRLTVQHAVTNMVGAAFLGQYAAGFRLRVAPSSAPFFLVFRTEFIGYVSHNGHDRFLSFGLGGGF